MQNLLECVALEIHENTQWKQELENSLPLTCKRPFSNRLTRVSLSTTGQELVNYKTAPGKQTFLPYGLRSAGKIEGDGKDVCQVVLKGRPFSVPQLPSVLQACKGFNQGREESEAPDSRRGIWQGSCPPGKIDFSRETLQARQAVPACWNMVDAVFPFETAPTSTCHVSTMHWGPAHTTTKPSRRSPPPWATHKS